MEMSLYQIAKLRKTRLKNLGYDYRGRILKNSLSSWVYNSSAKEFILQLESILTMMVSSIKSIRKSVNYMIDEDSDMIN